MNVYVLYSIHLGFKSFSNSLINLIFQFPLLMFVRSTVEFALRRCRRQTNKYELPAKLSVFLFGGRARKFVLCTVRGTTRRFAAELFRFVLVRRPRRVPERAQIWGRTRRRRRGKSSGIISWLNDNQSGARVCAKRLLCIYNNNNNGGIARRWLTVVCKFSLPRTHVFLRADVCVCVCVDETCLFHSKYAYESCFPPENGYGINDSRTEFPYVMFTHDFFLFFFLFWISRRSAKRFRLIFRFLLKPERYVVSPVPLLGIWKSRGALPRSHRSRDCCTLYSSKRFADAPNMFTENSR